ncbi:hypothetical protein ACX0G9_23735 [Flavitalea flava]
MKQINTLRQTIVNRSKKAAFVLALLLTVCTTYSFATPISKTDELSWQVKTSFKKEFRNAEIVSTEVNGKFTKLTFRMNNMVLFAFYSDKGELLAVVRNILSSQLPLNLMIDLKKDYARYWITELFELNGDGQNCYYVSLENETSTLILRSVDNDNWEVYKQTYKKN